MDKNCLVTKLKAVVDDNSLVKLGHYMVSFKGSKANGVIAGAGNNVTVDLVSGSGIHIYLNGDRNQELSFPVLCESTTYYEIVSDDPNEVYVLDFDNKYTATYIGFPLGAGIQDSMALEDIIIGFSSLTAIEGRGAETALVCNFDELVNKRISATRFANVYLRSIGVSGDIKNIPLVFPNMTLFCLYGSKVAGAIEDFIRSFRAIGKTTGSVSYSGWFRSATITFNGHTMESSSYDDVTISWTASTMTVGSETINA